MTTLIGVLPSGAKLNPGTGGGPGDNVVSPSMRYSLALQGDGNLVLSDTTTGAVLWHLPGFSGKSVQFCLMQGDGNFVVVGFPDIIWSTKTPNHPNSFLQVQNDGNVVIIQPLDPIWATNTAQPS